jgi:hypothetical protein
MAWLARSLVALGAALALEPAFAISITTTHFPAALQPALLGAVPGLTVTGFTRMAADFLQSGTYTNASGTYGVGDGIVLSTGYVMFYNDGPNLSPNKTSGINGGIAATASQEALLDPISGGSHTHYDVA